ncbi:hypothetical protein Uis4E_2165 [Bifidobacterium parmae]|uniref:Uncharacterized protein n=1 Tax=Bifidobacterium parmae TaxID=361854 RepID=A0A2N5IVK5_9BIFI|nr:hypothetical protein Uis4E_2165 [Bifidobacterium parmae]
MKPFSELREAASRAAQAEGLSLGEPAGVHDGELIFYAVPPDYEPGMVLGLPQGFFVDMETGRARYCTTDESEMLCDRGFLYGLGPVPE